MVKPVPEGEVLPHPAEDLSSDDDLLSWILVDQLGCLPNTKLGVHPQQVKFVGPPFKTADILSIVQETVIRTDINEAMRRFLEFHLIKAHCDAKQTPKQKERFLQHLRRYLLPLLPTSRIEIYTTNRYSAVTGHTELAVYATRPLPEGIVLQELQGSVVPLPDAWRAEMDLGDEFALEAAGQEGDTDEEEDDEDDARTGEGRTTEDGLEEGSETPSKRGGRRKKESRGARRSDRTKRRDFSIVWSGLKRCYQLFLGPARFLNHDCNPNVELLRQGKYVTFRVIRPIRIGDEVMTFYGENYFGKDNVECLCLSCEQAGRNGFAPKASSSNTRSRSRSQSMTSSMRAASPPSRRTAGPSALRTALNDLRHQSPSTSTENEVEAGPSGSQLDADEPATPQKLRSRPNTMLDSVNSINSPSTESVRSEVEPESPSDDNPPKRERYHRRAARNAQHFSFLKRPRKKVLQEPAEALPADDEDEDCVRCATCAKAMHERIWYNNKYFDHCARCVRHALIFDLPWPAHRSTDVLDYPPSHLIPAGYIPPRVSSIALPSLDKHRKKHVEPAPVSPQGETHAERRARKFRQECAMEDLRIEQLREAAWTAQDTAETQAKAAAQAKVDAKAKKVEEKRLKDQNKIKGSGVWSRYEYIDEAELERRRLARMAVTTGTRRGGRFKPPSSDGEEEVEEPDAGTGLAAESDPRASMSRPAPVPKPNGHDSKDSTAEEAVVEQHDQLALASPSRQTTPVSAVQPKVERSSTGRSKRVRDMEHIEISDGESYDSTEIVCLGMDGPTERLFAHATKVTARQGGEVSDGDSDMMEAEVSPSAKIGSSKTNGSASKSGVTKPVPALGQSQGSALNTNGGEVEGSQSPTKRGRGRPRGSGKKQRAAALHAARVKPAPSAPAVSASTPKAGPSRATKGPYKSKAFIDTEDEMSEAERQPTRPAAAGPTARSKVNGNAEGSRNFLLHVENQIERLTKSSPRYLWMIESLDHEGALAWKELRETTGDTPFPPEEVLREFVDMEHGEFLRKLELSRKQKGMDSSDIRQLPGQRHLVNRAELQRWYPSRTLPKADDQSLDVPLDRPYKTVGGLEVVGYTVDTYACGQDGPNSINGPWRNGHYRMIAARAVSDDKAQSGLPMKLDAHKRHLVIDSGSTRDKGKTPASSSRPPSLAKVATSAPSSSRLSRKSPSTTPVRPLPSTARQTPSAPRPSSSTSNGPTKAATSSASADTPTSTNVKSVTSTAMSSSPATKTVHTNASTDTLVAIADKYRKSASSLIKPSGSTFATTSAHATGHFVNGHARRTSLATGSSSASPAATAVSRDQGKTPGSTLPNPPASTMTRISLADNRSQAPPNAPASSQSTSNGSFGSRPSPVTQAQHDGKPDHRNEADSSLAGGESAAQRFNKRKLEYSLSPVRKRPVSWLGGHE